MWQKSHRFDQEVRPLADRHYNRRKADSPQFAPPGRCLVLKRPDAFWITSWPFAEYVKHAWPGAWVCSAFRNEGEALSSDLVRAAVDATLAHTPWTHWPRVWCPYCKVRVSMVSFIDAKHVRRKRDYGRCYIKAGWTQCKGRTKAGLYVVHL